MLLGYEPWTRAAQHRNAVIQLLVRLAPRSLEVLPTATVWRALRLRPLIFLDFEVSRALVIAREQRLCLGRDDGARVVVAENLQRLNEPRCATHHALNKPDLDVEVAFLFVRQFFVRSFWRHEQRVDGG